MHRADAETIIILTCLIKFISWPQGKQLPQSKQLNEAQKPKRSRTTDNGGAMSMCVCVCALSARQAFSSVRAKVGNEFFWYSINDDVEAEMPIKTAIDKRRLAK